ncbi:MAG: PAS domain S-box protein [Rhodocyclaceae bacterium]|jgi:PAS domain S-box-containing protein|nr:PAS domain S-box protein [Rhodocyclaceae bacterium]MBK6554343.1 PAS domain S-box protein [Rhodocyclaceae bacterium]MBK6677705.1 PAS domain S-box protein [Rhodocyclaceae bacterium]MBK9310374.1 PAS domain S-box protein [Rhodocyclaceae bacterium]
MAVENESTLLALVVLGWMLTSVLIGAVVMTLRLREARQRLRDKEEEHEAVLERLRDNEYRLRAIIESEPECVKLQAVDGTVLEINPAGLALVGAERDEDIVGKKIYTVVAPEYRDHYRENMRRVFAGESIVYEFKSITLKGRTAWMETHAVPLRDARGAIYALLGITRDITERKWGEEQARRHQTELARVARLSTMGEMATGIAHELNQPLAAIANFARGCLRRLRGGDVAPDDLLQPLEEICAQAERAGEVMRHVRDFVRKRETRMTAVDINRVVQGAAKLTELECRQNHAVVMLDLVPGQPRVWADSIMIEQVICNLIRNSVEAMAEARSPVRRVNLSTSRPDGDTVEIVVGDTGPGIDGVLIDRVFDQFFTTKPEGVGMGLSISRSIVESHGGGLRAESAAGGGATFRFTLRAIGRTLVTNERRYSFHH